MSSSCHTKQWCSQSRCSQWCSCRTFWGSEGPCQVFSASWWGRGVVVPSSWLCWCMWTMTDALWCEHWGTWSSRPALLQPSRCKWGMLGLSFPVVQDQLICLTDVEGEVVVLAPHCHVSDLPIGCLIVVGDQAPSCRQQTYWWCWSRARPRSSGWTGRFSKQFIVLVSQQDNS